MAPFDWQLSSDEDAIDSDDSKSSPCGSVKINRLSCLDWPESGEAPKLENQSLPLTSSEDSSLQQYGGDQRLEGYDTALRRSSSLKIPDEEGKASADRSLRDCSQASTLTAQWIPYSSDDTIYRATTWDAASKVWTIVTSLEYGRVRIHHIVQLMTVIPQQMIPAKQVSLPFFMRNGGSCPQTVHFKRGQLVSFVVTKDATVSPCEQEEQITVVRHVQDLNQPLQLYFVHDYSLKDGQVVVPIPSLSPMTSKLLSEIVYIAASSPPLTTKPLTRQQLSTWKLGSDTTDQVTQYERLPMQRLFPERFSDDIRLHVSDPYPVIFRSLGDSDFSDVVWDFTIGVERLLDVQLVCKMSLNLHVGRAYRLLLVDSQGWIPEHSIINGRLATQEWRQDKGRADGMILFRQPGMINGPLKVDIFWHKSQDAGHFKLSLPYVREMKVLPGKLTCKVDRAFVILNNTGVIEGTYAFIDGPETYLPELCPGYQMYLTHFSEPSQPASRIVPEAEEPVTKLEPAPTKSGNPACDEACHNTLNVKEYTRPHQEDKAHITVSNAVCILLVLGWAFFCNLWLVPLFESSVESLRLETSYASVEDVTVLVPPKEPTGAVAAYLEDEEEETSRLKDWEETESPLLRDWVDCLLGWGGDVCKREQDMGN